MWLDSNGPYSARTVTGWDDRTTVKLSVCNISSCMVERSPSEPDETSLAFISFVPKMIEVVGVEAWDIESKVEEEATEEITFLESRRKNPVVGSSNLTSKPQQPGKFFPPPPHKERTTSPDHKCWNNH